MRSPVDDAAATPDAWGAVASTYRWQEPLERRSISVLLQVLAPRDNEVLLDVGAGVGHVARRAALTRTGSTAVVEPSARMVEVGSFAGAVALRADATRLPVADASVDVVTASWLLHVLTPPERAAAVAEAARVLRPGGRLGVVVPATPRTTLQHIVRSVAHTATSARGLQAFTVPADLPGLLTDHGLQVRHHSRTGRGYLADVVVCTRAAAPAATPTAGQASP